MKNNSGWTIGEFLQIALKEMRPPTKYDIMREIQTAYDENSEYLFNKMFENLIEIISIDNFNCICGEWLDTFEVYCKQSFVIGYLKQSDSRLGYLSQEVHKYISSTKKYFDLEANPNYIGMCKILTDTIMSFYSEGKGSQHMPSIEIRNIPPWLR